MSATLALNIPVELHGEVPRTASLSQVVEHAEHRKRGELGSADARSEKIKRLLAGLRVQEWAVDSQPPFAGPQRVLKYLARYTHRVAVADSRLRCLEGDTVVFTVKDSATGELIEDRLDAVEFLRRFVQHILPRGFIRIRSYGLLAHRCRREDLGRSRVVLGAASSEPSREEKCAEDGAAAEPLRCRHCEQGWLVFVALLPRLSPHRTRPRAPP